MNNRELVMNGIEIQKSLDIALQKAGANIENINKHLREISAIDFLSEIATNNIRFVYQP